jgi:hypothetical protein
LQAAQKLVGVRVAATGRRVVYSFGMLEVASLEMLFTAVCQHLGLSRAHVHFVRHGVLLDGATNAFKFVQRGRRRGGRPYPGLLSQAGELPCEEEDIELVETRTPWRRREALLHRMVSADILHRLAKFLMQCDVPCASQSAEGDARVHTARQNRLGGRLDICGAAEPPATAPLCDETLKRVFALLPLEDLVSCTQARVPQLEVVGSITTA